MKLMPVTMLVVIPIFAWLATFIDISVTSTSSTSISVPWALNVNMKSSNILPNWVLLYSLLTLPFSQVLTKVLKYFSFSKRLKNIESGEFVPAPRTNL